MTVTGSCPDDDTFPFRSLLPNQTPSVRASFGPRLVPKFDILTILWMWQSGDSLPRFEVADEDTSWPLYGLSPARTKMVTVSS